jgi:BACON domain-containing protein
MRKYRARTSIVLLTLGAIWASTAFAEDGGGSTLSISVSSLSFTAVSGGAAPASKSFTVSANRTTQFSISASVQNSSVNWLSISPSGTLYTNKTITVSVAPGSLAAGTYGGSIRVSANGSTRTIPVSFVLTAPPPPATLSVSPSSMTFNATAGGTVPNTQSLSVTAANSTSFTAAANGVSGTTRWLAISPSGTLTGNSTLTVSANQSGLAAGTYAGSISLVANGVTTTVTVSFVVASSTSPPPPTGAGFKIIGWNDLGMHCFDGKDYSVFAVLPPFNTIHAHLIDSGGKLVTSPTGYTLTYQAVNDPLTNTLNTSSAAKTNFWQYAAAIGFGILAPDMGLKGFGMPGASNTPQAMAFSTDNSWQAVGIPITPYADSATGQFPTNYFPMMRLSAKNSSGTVLATTDIVLPISDEMTCSTCHASTSTSGAAKPSAGWANLSNPAKDVKVNILRKHDDRFKTSSLFQTAAASFGYSTSGLEATYPTKPILCATCHGSNALSLPGYTGIPPLTTSMHKLHSSATDPVSGQNLDTATTRTACYSCHPGSKTQCLRGAMATLKDAKGVNLIECQSCHGNLSAVAAPARKGWLDEPSCQMCHTGTAVVNSGQIVYTSVFSSGTTPRVAADQTFATNANTPATGLSMYRFSAGHGGLQCEACHNSTHAEYTSAIANDNLQSTNLQGHTGTVAECSACHGSSVPTTVTGGPHGLHPIGSSWVSQHPNAANANRTSCQVCHGTDYRGTILSKTRTDRSMAGRFFPAGTIISCYSCHNGPNGD